MLAHVLGVQPKEVEELTRQLIGVGLAEDMGDEHLRIDPALPSYLLRGVGEEERTALRGRWAEGMEYLTTFVNQRRGQDAGLAARLTLLEVPNLLAMLRRAEEMSAPEKVADLAR